MLCEDIVRAHFDALDVGTTLKEWRDDPSINRYIFRFETDDGRELRADCNMVSGEEFPDIWLADDESGRGIWLKAQWREKPDAVVPKLKPEVQRESEEVVSDQGFSLWHPWGGW